MRSALWFINCCDWRPASHGTQGAGRYIGVCFQMIQSPPNVLWREEVPLAKCSLPRVLPTSMPNRLVHTMLSSNRALARWEVVCKQLWTQRPPSVPTSVSPKVHSWQLALKSMFFSGLMCFQLFDITPVFLRLLPSPHSHFFLKQPRNLL